MLKKILSVLFIISIFLFYLYYGFRLMDNFSTKEEVIFYLIAYGFLGITLLNLYAVSIYWEKLNQKRGPPGPRGIMGEPGVSGSEGKCSIDHNIMYASLKIKEAISNYVVEKSGLLEKEIYNRETNVLKNSFLDTSINRILLSKEFDTILLKPSRNEEIKYGKSLKDIIGYLKSIILEWVDNILKMENGTEFFKTVDATFTFTPEIENYFHNEIEKYDIWYWGGTRIFKPLEITVMRQTQFTDKNGKLQQNTAFPVNDKPRLHFIEIEYSDYDTSKLEWLWDSSGMNNATQNFNAWNNAYKSKNGGNYGKFTRPAIYIPKIKNINGYNYYPLGCVMIETNNSNKSREIKKTVLVTGDVIIPKKYTLMWKDRKRAGQAFRRGAVRGNITPSDGDYAGMFWRVESHDSNYITLGDFCWGVKTNSSDMWAGIGLSILGGIFAVGTAGASLALTTGSALSAEKNPNKRKKQFTTPSRNLEEIKDSRNINSLKNYKGIVAIPKEFVIEVPKAKNPEWSYRHHSDDLYYSNFSVDIFSVGNENYNIIRVQDGRWQKQLLSSTNQKYGPDNTNGGKFYKINTEKLQELNNPIKEIDEQNSQYTAIGQYGYPFLKADKYSIFKFLELVPEGMIININNNRKLYIRHYGGVDMNRYNIYKFNTETKKFDKALRAISPDRITFGRLDTNDKEFGFMVEKDPNKPEYIRFKNYKWPNDGYLEYITNITNTNMDDNRSDRPGAISIDHMNSIFKLTKEPGDNNTSNNKIFMFLPAHGRHFSDKTNNNLLKTMTHPNQKINFTPN